MLGAAQARDPNDSSFAAPHGGSAYSAYSVFGRVAFAVQALINAGVYPLGGTSAMPRDGVRPAVGGGSAPVERLASSESRFGTTRFADIIVACIRT